MKSEPGKQNKARAPEQRRRGKRQSAKASCNTANESQFNRLLLVPRRRVDENASDARMTQRGSFSPGDLLLNASCTFSFPGYAGFFAAAVATAHAADRRSLTSVYLSSCCEGGTCLLCSCVSSAFLAQGSAACPAGAEKAALRGDHVRQRRRSPTRGVWRTPEREML